MFSFSSTSQRYYCEYDQEAFWGVVEYHLVDQEDVRLIISHPEIPRISSFPSVIQHVCCISNNNDERIIELLLRNKIVVNQVISAPSCFLSLVFVE